MDGVALLKQVFGHEVRRAHGIGRGPDQGDCLHVLKDLSDIVGAVAVVVHLKFMAT